MHVVNDVHQPVEGYGEQMNVMSRRVTAALTWLVVLLVAVPSAWSQSSAEPAKKPEATQPAKPATPAAQPAASGAPDTAKVPKADTKPKSGALKSSSSSQYDNKLRELEEKVVGLKERIYKTKTRLLLLKERILNDVIAEAKAIIVHSDEMGPSFKLQRVIYHLDGDKIYYQDENSGNLEGKERFEVYSANVLPGNHVLSVEMTYRGDSSVFTYMKDYVFRLRANFTFYATKGKITRVESVGYKKGDITWDLTKRPSITFRVRQTSYSKDAVDKVRGPKGRKP